MALLFPVGADEEVGMLRTCHFGFMTSIYTSPIWEGEIWIEILTGPLFSDQTVRNMLERGITNRYIINLWCAPTRFKSEYLLSTWRNLRSLAISCINFHTTEPDTHVQLMYLRVFTLTVLLESPIYKSDNSAKRPTTTTTTYPPSVRERLNRPLISARHAPQGTFSHTVTLVLCIPYIPALVLCRPYIPAIVLCVPYILALVLCIPYILALVFCVPYIPALVLCTPYIPALVLCVPYIPALVLCVPYIQALVLCVPYIPTLVLCVPYIPALVLCVPYIQALVLCVPYTQALDLCVPYIPTLVLFVPYIPALVLFVPCTYQL